MEKGHQIPLMKEVKNKLFPRKLVKQSTVKEYFLFLRYLAAVMLCRQVFFSLCAIFEEKKIICQIILV